MVCYGCVVCYGECLWAGGITLANSGAMAMRRSPYVLIMSWIRACIWLRWAGLNPVASVYSLAWKARRSAGGRAVAILRWGGWVLRYQVLLNVEVGRFWRVEHIVFGLLSVAPEDSDIVLVKGALLGFIGNRLHLPLGNVGDSAEGFHRVTMDLSGIDGFALFTEDGGSVLDWRW